MNNITTHTDPAFRYEDLARFAFECGKWQDPWSYAAQDVYNSVLKADIKSKKILITILNVLIFKNKDSVNCKELLMIENLIDSVKSQSDVINIIDKTISILEKS